MRVIVDARTVYAAVRRGTGKNLIDLYRLAAQRRPDWEFLMLHRQAPVVDDPFSAIPNVSNRAIDIRGDRWNLWEHVRLPIGALTRRGSVLHAPANTAPVVAPVPVVVTIHDLIGIDTAADEKAARLIERRLRRSARIARRVITPSAFTKELLVQRLGVEASKVVVNHWAPDRSCIRVESAEQRAAVQRMYGLTPGRSYVFGFGAADPRKNTQRLVQAWAGLPGRIRSELSLLLVGLQEPMLTKMRTLATELAPEGGWSLMPFANEGDVTALLSGATLLCYPSLSEGFGLPIVDAFACSTAVVTSETSSLPEVAGDAALLVNPESVEEIRAAVQRLATDDALRRDLIARGNRRLQAFSWEKCADTLVGVLADAA